MKTDFDNKSLDDLLNGLLNKKRKNDRDIQMDLDKKEKEALKEAEEFFFHLKDWEKTADLFEQREAYLEAAFIYKKSGNIEKSTKNFYLAAQTFENRGLFDKAAYIYEINGNIQEAAQIFEKLYYDKEVAYYADASMSKDDYLYKTVELYLKLNNTEKAYKLLKTGEKFEMAASLLIRLGQLESAAELLEKNLLPLKAADVYEKIGNTQKAYQLKAEAAHLINDASEAVKWYLKAGNLEMAAKCFEQLNEWENAADCYYKVENYFHAGECFLKSSNQKEALKMFELAGDWENAADILFNLKNFKKAGLYYEECKNNYRAGYAFLKSNNHIRSIKNFQKVPNTSPDYIDSVIQVSILFLKDNKPELAITKIEKLLNEEKEISENHRLLLYYQLGQAYEGVGNTKKAADFYRVILQKDYLFKDVQKKLDDVERLEQKYKLLKLERENPNKRYKMIREIGEGGMGIVYKAEDLYLQRTVAIKVLKGNLARNKDNFEMFYGEAKAAAALNHPNIVKIYDFGQINEDYFISLDYCEGDDLHSILRNKGIFSIESIVNIAQQIGKGLSYAHKNGVIHRDIKPHNIILTKGGEIKITDFGLASMKGQQIIDREESISGTPHYMSPEQILREKIDHRIDIYSTGVTLFHLITGDVPFKGKRSEVFRQHILEPVPPIKKIRPEVPDTIVRIVETCMEKKPDDRYEDAQEIANEAKKIVSMLPTPREIVKKTKAKKSVDKTAESKEIPTEKISNAEKLVEGDDSPTILSKDFNNITSFTDFTDEDTLKRETKTFKR